MWSIAFLFLFADIFIIDAKRAGVTQCSTEAYPSSFGGGVNTIGTGRAYMVEDKDWQFQCCGVVSKLNYNLADPSAPLELQVWRQKDAKDYELISRQNVTVASGDEIPENERVSFRDGDYLGWYTSSEITYSAGTVYGNRYTASGNVNSLNVNPASYETYAWANEDAEVDKVFNIQAETAASEPPYFTNLPYTLVMKQNDVKIKGVLLTTLLVTDRNPDDRDGLTVRMNPDWIDVFSFDSNTLELKTNTRLRKEQSPYLPVFRVEEDHCGLATTATLTVSVTNSAPTTNLPAYANVHEDEVDEMLLYTIILSDEEDEAVWCKGDWTIGQEGTGGMPFIVKMISTTAGSSSAGIYLIEWPKLDFDSTSVYTLPVECRDTADNIVTGTFTVNIIENQKPIFLNLDNSVQVDATQVRTGSTIFTVSSTDPDGDQVTYSSSCTPVATCPVTMFNSGHVMLTEEILFHVGSTEYVLEITPSDHRASNTARNLTIFIINISNAPVLTNVNGVTINVKENTAASTSLFQVSATDSDTDDTLEFSMTINPTVGAQYFSINSTTGVVSTHSSNVINYENLGGGTTFNMSVMVHDGKQLVKDYLVLEVQDENEAPKFVQPAFGAASVEGVSGTILTTAANLVNMVIDPDDATWSFTLDCGATYNAYFSMDSTTGGVTFAQDYDLDDTALEQEHSCIVMATDSVGNTATATYFISISYANDNTPIFSPVSYAVTVGADTVFGTSVLQVNVTDDDAGTDGEFEFTLDETALLGHYFVVGSTGIITVDASLAAFASGGTYTITVTANDTGGLASTANIDITFTETATTTTTTTVSIRDIEFIEDARNVAWLTPAVITMVIVVGIILFMIIRCIREKLPGSPLLTLNFKLPTLIRPRITKERDDNNQPISFGRQRGPVIRHIHAKDLKVAPIFSQKPNAEPKEDTKPKPPSKTEKTKKEDISINELDTVSAEKVTEERASVTKDLRDDISWMDRNPSQGAKSVAPATVVTHPKSADRDYLNPKTPKSNGSRMFSPKTASPSPSVTISPVGPEPIRVTPSPLSWNNTGEEDDVSLPESLRAITPDQD